MVKVRNEIIEMLDIRIKELQKLTKDSANKEYWKGAIHGLAYAKDEIEKYIRR